MKEKFNQLISATVTPLLKLNGFIKKGPSFQKSIHDLIFILNFQKSQGNFADHTKFYINCGIHSTAIDEAIGKKKSSEPKEYDCYFRARISAITKSEIDGYLLTAETDLQELNNKISSDLKTVLTMFDSIKSTNDLSNLMINENGLNNYEELFDYLLLTQQYSDLKRYVKKLHTTFGRENRWKIFEGKLASILTARHREEKISDFY